MVLAKYNWGSFKVPTNRLQKYRIICNSWHLFIKRCYKIGDGNTHFQEKAQQDLGSYKTGRITQTDAQTKCIKSTPMTPLLKLPFFFYGPHLPKAFVQFWENTKVVEAMRLSPVVSLTNQNSTMPTELSREKFSDLGKKLILLVGTICRGSHCNIRCVEVTRCVNKIKESWRYF